MFLSEESHFNDSRLFDVVALTGEILPLEVWFMINLNSRAKGEQIQAAYRCFMFMIDVGIDKADGGGTKGVGVSLVEETVKKDNILTGLLKLSKVVMVTILG